MANATKAVRNEEIRKMKTAADFNREEEEKAKKKKEEEAKAEVEKKPVMTRDGKFYMCAHKGCVDKKFVPE